jgi:hypothetical protein
MRDSKCLGGRKALEIGELEYLGFNGFIPVIRSDA